MKKILRLLALVAVPTSLWAFSASSGAVYLGEWNSGYTKGRTYAEENHVPMLLLWARTSCPMCNNLKSALSGADFQEWAVAHRIVMSVCHDGESDSGKALSFIRSANAAMSDLPFLCVYWPKADGTTVLRSFVGRSGRMPVKTGTLALQLAGSIESILTEAGFDFSETLNAPRSATEEVMSTPSFVDPFATLDSIQYVAIDRTFALNNVADGVVKIKKVSGALPSGVKMTYDAGSQSVRFGGTAKKTGTFTSAWKVTEKRSSGTVSGTSVFTLTVNVVPVTQVTSVFSAKTLKTTGIVLSDAGDLQGVVSLTLAQTGRASVKYETAGAQLKATSAGWANVTSDGALEVVGSGNGCSFVLSVSAAGALDGTWTGSDGNVHRIQFSRTVWSVRAPASAYVMDRKIGLGDEDFALQVSMKEAGAKTGVLSVKGVLPGRVRINAKGGLVEREDGCTAFLPILKKSGKSWMTGLLLVTAESHDVSGTVKYQGRDGIWQQVTLP